MPTVESLRFLGIDLLGQECSGVCHIDELALPATAATNWLFDSEKSCDRQNYQAECAGLAVRASRLGGQYQNYGGSGTLISHAGADRSWPTSWLGQAATISALIETMIEAALSALGVAATRFPVLFDASQTPTASTTVLLAPIAGTANEEHCPTVCVPAKTLPKNGFAV